MIIIIHPGSSNLRIGRASDINCTTITHAVARRRNPGGGSYREGFLPRIKNGGAGIEECRLKISHVLQSTTTSIGTRRYATPPQQISAFNRRSKPEIVRGTAPDWMSLETVVGDDIFKINPADGFNIHYPIKRGQLNLYPGIGGSLFNVLDNLQTIWEYAIVKKLGIPLRELANYKAVLVIPDIFNRTHVKELTNLLLIRLGFDSCFLVQDHVAGLFGSGLGFGCIVDVGAEKTSVSCVEDGVSQPNTRVCIEYGGSDITHLFVWLLQKCSFPYKECNLEDPVDFLLMTRLKEENCHLNVDICGAREQSFLVTRPGHSLEYTIQFGDELLIAPLSLFHTELLNLTGPKIARTQSTNKCLIDPEDCFGAVYLTEFGLPRRGTKEQNEQTNDAAENADEDMVDNVDNEREVLGRENDFFVPGSVMGLDQAILQSIERCPTEEMRKKMFSSILLVGGSIKFAGVEKWLQSRLSKQIPVNYKPEIILSSAAKDMDPAMTTWKGAAIMSCLESAAELFITKKEWERQGVKILREKTPFNW